ncbi:hypothetical protein CJD36_004955 [Flavipsychrobacter stenotrophus]|uniref:Uncharacterized protein n=1 Tax=Flavipsychrobacter stenotrophus TaxID=2077091 RepID=A0A2S7T2R9_9BACT|nr:hypothetical protein [Flavipsychrobacter stenotrophus]PQJ13095.1 hypothetical protein CJD36_004955 [Flavipsychrobacter stenotrophus]
MKKIILMCSVAMVALTAGCKKVKDLADISVDIPYTQQVTVPPVDGYTFGFPLPAGGVNLPFPAFAVPTNSKSYLDQYHTTSAKVRKVDLKGLTIQLTAPASQNFDFLDTVQLFIAAPSQPEVLVAYGYNIPKSQTIFVMTTNSDVNLKDYFLQDTMYFRTNMHVNAVPAPGAQMNIKSVFNLVANPLY